MGIINRVLAQAAKGPEDDHWYLPGGSYYGGLIPTEAGVSLGPDSAMRLITVQNCVRMRATTLSRLPCHLMRRNGKMREQATDYYLYELLHDQPNSWMTAPEFWMMAEAYVCFRGNFYAYKLGLEGRPVQELIPLPDGMVQKVRQNEDYSLTYEVRFRTGEVRPVEGSRIFHLRGLTLDGITGVNPIEYARETVGTGLAAYRFLARYFGAGMHPGAIFKHPKGINPALKDALKDQYAGLGKSHEAMLIEDGMDVTFPTIKLVDAQYIEQMKLTDAQICGLFRVPLMLVNGGDKEPTYASAEQFMLFYQMLSIDCPVYESAIRRDLLTPEERRQYYAKFEMRALQRGSFKEQMEGFGTGIDKEIYNPNEVREWLELNPYEGGNEYRTRTSTVKNPDQGGQEK